MTRAQREKGLRPRLRLTVEHDESEDESEEELLELHESLESLLSQPSLLDDLDEDDELSPLQPLESSLEDEEVVVVCSFVSSETVSVVSPPHPSVVVT